MNKLLLILLIGLGLQIQAQNKFISAPSGLNMRTAPALNADKIVTVPYGSRVTLLEGVDEEVYVAETWGNWVKVQWGTKTGWVFGGFVSDVHPEYFGTLDLSAQDYLSEIFTAEDLDYVLPVCRVEVENGEVTEDGKLENNIEFESDGVAYVIHFEKGVRYYFSEGYEWGETSYIFTREQWTIDEVFDIAASMNGNLFSGFLMNEDGEIALPTEPMSKTWEGQYETEYLEVKFEEGGFQSFRWESEEGCSTWFYFEVDDAEIRFGDGGGC